MTAADVVILGAGIMGASAAWHLACRGVRRIVLLDRGTGPGAGSTARATGGFRAQYATPINVRLSLLTRAKLERFVEDTGVDPGYAPHGYLWLATAEHELAALAEARSVQQAAGLSEAAAVTPADVRRLNPAVAVDGVVGGAWCPTDGFLRPLALLAGYLDSAQRLSVVARWGVEASGLELGADGRVTAVRAGAERVPCGMVVNALGAWAGGCGIMDQTGFALPVSPLRRQVAVTVPTDALPASMPMTIFVADGFHLRVRDGRVLLLLPTAGAPGRPFDDSVEPEWIQAVLAKAHARVPTLRHVPVDPAACWAGLYEMSPDKHAILGATPGVPNFFLINGSSGHGVMHAPALGQLLAEIICDGQASSLDVRPLRPERFAERNLNPVSELL
ncbi:MAG TPA: FAD-dependent oxidoreductase [Gemmatimonadales bacterium]|nr:FAD-dependent oxidoreductase [Gemmatimonadales bacterium]